MPKEEQFIRKRDYCKHQRRAQKETMENSKTEQEWVHETEEPVEDNEMDEGFKQVAKENHKKDKIWKAGF